MSDKAEPTAIKVYRAEFGSSSFQDFGDQVDFVCADFNTAYNAALDVCAFYARNGDKSVYVISIQTLSDDARLIQ